MRQTIISLISLLIILLMSSCNSRHDHQIATALSLTDSDKADSALSLLQKIDRNQLSEADEARYCLAYTIAQDKAGITIDNDSLIRTAYEWYNKRQDDPLYARSQYSMGKYYVLNDSTEKALRCFAKAMKTAQQKKDLKIEALALLQTSAIHRKHDAGKAVQEAISAFNIYNKVKATTIKDNAYAMLNLAECLFMRDGGSRQCFESAHKAIELARQSQDSTTIADAYQRTSVLYKMDGQKRIALKAAKLSYDFSNKQDVSVRLTIAQAYFDVDSFSQAKSIIQQIPTEKYKNHVVLINTLLREIALKEHAYEEASQLMDSTEVDLEKENDKTEKAKNQYYSELIQTRAVQAKIERENNWNSRLVIFIIILSLVVISILIAMLVQSLRRNKKKIQEQNIQHSLELKNRETQMTTMRNIIIQKIAVMKNLQNEELAYKKQHLIITDNDWKEITTFLEYADNQFVSRLQQNFPSLTKKDIRFLMLIRLGVPYNNLAIIYNIEAKSIKQKLFLLKTKLGIKNTKISTKEFIRGF